MSTRMDIHWQLGVAPEIVIWQVHQIVRPVYIKINTKYHFVSFKLFGNNVMAVDFVAQTS